MTPIATAARKDTCKLLFIRYSLFPPHSFSAIISPFSFPVFPAEDFQSSLPPRNSAPNLLLLPLSSLPNPVFAFLSAIHLPRLNVLLFLIAYLVSIPFLLRLSCISFKFYYFSSFLSRFICILKVVIFFLSFFDYFCLFFLFCFLSFRRFLRTSFPSFLLSFTHALSLDHAFLFLFLSFFFFLSFFRFDFFLFCFLSF